MLCSKKWGGLRIFTRNNFLPSPDDVRKKLETRDGVILREEKKSKRKRLVIKSVFDGKPVVIKQEFFVFRLDRTLKAFFFGSNAANVIRAVDAARERGFTDTCDYFFVAERFRFGILRETISVMEFLEGKTLDWKGHTPEQKIRVKNLLEQAHREGIVSGDVHPQNFIETPNGIKLIDFCGHKIFPAVAKARDRAGLETRFGIPNDCRDCGWKVYRIQLALRNFLRRIRGLNKLET